MNSISILINFYSIESVLLFPFFSASEHRHHRHFYCGSAKDEFLLKFYSDHFHYWSSFVHFDVFLQIKWHFGIDSLVMSCESSPLCFSFTPTVLVYIHASVDVIPSSPHLWSWQLTKPVQSVRLQVVQSSVHLFLLRDVDVSLCRFVHKGRKDHI